jgi:CBS-domain-containing membrane protein
VVHHDETTEGEPLVADYMKADVVTIGPDATVKELAQLFHENDISGCPVVDDKDRLIGIVTESDLIAQDADLHFPRYIQFLDSQIFLESPKKFEERLRRITGATVRELMTVDVYTVEPETSVRKAATTMADKGINRLPVVDDIGRVIGILGRNEVLKAMGL